MLRVVRLCGSDRLCVALCVAAIVSLSIAHLADRATASAIPDRCLGRIRGANPAWSENFAGSCTAVNVMVANNMNPPPPPGTGPYVGFSGCTIVGAACIYCGTGPGYNTYESVEQAGANPINIKIPMLVECMTGEGGGGTIGTCDLTLTCTSSKPYDCNTTGPYWSYQGGGGPS